MSIGTRLTFFEKTLEKYKHLQEGLDQMNEDFFVDQSNCHQTNKKIHVNVSK